MRILCATIALAALAGAVGQGWLISRLNPPRPIGLTLLHLTGLTINCLVFLASTRWAVLKSQKQAARRPTIERGRAAVPADDDLRKAA